jgi:transposase
MKKPIKTIDEKEAIITEYLTGRTTFRKLGAKYGIDFRMINSWVMEYQGRNLKSSQPSAPEPAKEPPLITDVNELQKEVRRLQLHNKLLNAIIDIAEDELNIDIRKKSGTKQ